MSWIGTMLTLVSTDELAKDVTGAEALLERHQVRFTLQFQRVYNYFHKTFLNLKVLIVI